MSNGTNKFFGYVLISLIVSITVYIISFFHLNPVLERMKDVEVPNLIGTSLEQSRSILESKNLVLSLEGEKESTLVEEGKIADQIPAGGAIVDSGFRIKVFISKGKIELPDFSGLLLEEVKDKLEQLGLKLGEQEEVYSESISAGKIVSTKPAYNSKVKKGERVTLLISKGSGKVTVPNLLGKKLTTVQAILRRKKLKIGEIKHACDEERAFDIILRQYPRPGAKIDRKGSVDITINSEATE